MYLEKESIEKRFKRRISSFFLIVFILLSIVTTAVKYSEAKDAVLSQLERKHHLVESSFSLYLQKAEFELSGVSQLFSNSQLEDDREMHSLFSNHDGFLLGSIDFIYVERNDGRSILDPRSSLYLEDSADLYSVFSKIGQWFVFSVGEGNYFLVFKKGMVSSEGIGVGYIYGFISLSNNFAMAQSLLMDVNIDGIKLSNSQGDTIFEERGARFMTEEGVDSYGSVLNLPDSLATLELRVFLKKADFFSFEEELAYQIFLLAIALLSCFLIVVFLSQRAIFNVMSDAIADLSITKNTKYKELDEIEKIIYGKNASEKEQARALQILMEGAASAVIFCDEVASVLRMNQEAKKLYHDAEGARTLFDFMPIISHAPIQQALKGEAGTSFTLSFSQVNKILHWRLYPYISKSGFRGLVLIGSDITKETQLEWQLSQVKPISFSGMQQLTSEELLSELHFLSGRCDYSNGFPIGKWLSALAFGLEGIRGDDIQEDTASLLGKLLCNELSRMPMALHTHDDLFVDCRLEAACVLYPWPLEFKSLISSILMMTHSSELVEHKAICFKVEESKLVIDVTGVSHARDIFLKLVGSLVEKIGAKLNIDHERGFSIVLPYSVAEKDDIEIPAGSQVVWIENGYEKSSLMQSILRNLDIELVCINSAEDIFLKSMKLDQIDAILVGCSYQSDEDYEELLETMSMMLGRSDLPIAKVSFNNPFNDQSLALDYYPFDYSVAELLISLFQLRSISPDDMLPKGRNWLLIGGTKVSKAILRNELIEQDIVSHFLDDMDSSLSLLNHYKIEVIIALEQMSPELLLKIKLEFPSITVLLTQKSNQSNGEKCFPMRPPYDAGCIKDMITFVDTSNNMSLIEGR